MLRHLARVLDSWFGGLASPAALHPAVLAVGAGGTTGAPAQAALAPTLRRPLS